LYFPEDGLLRPNHVGCVDERRTIRNSVYSVVTSVFTVIQFVHGIY
jgi:hypothetical protein